MNDTPIYSTILQDEPDLAPIVGRFIKHLPSMLGDMKLAWQQRDWARLHGIAHELKGTAGNLGFPQLMHAADRIDTHAKQQNGAGVDQLLAELDQLAARVVVNS